MNADAPSPYRIGYRREGRLLRAHFTGTNGSLETTLACWNELAGEVRRQPPGALLVVDDMEGEPPPPEQIAQFVQAMVGQGFEGVRVAYVEAHAHQIPDVEHGEILAREIGFDARVFADEDAARVWLHYGPRDAAGQATNATEPGAAGLSGSEGAQPGYDIDFHQEADCIVAEVAGWIDDVDAIIDLFLRCGGELRKARVRKLLVLDQTRGVVPPEAEMRRLIHALEGGGFEAVRVAWVDVRGTAIGRIEVAEILGRERGYECRVFDNQQHARIWLDYGEA